MIDDPNSSKREIVPTSDDEDIFFISQTSQDTGSTSRSVAEASYREIRQEQEEVDEEDDEEEPVLPVRRLPAVPLATDNPASNITTSAALEQLPVPQTSPLPSPGLHEAEFTSPQKTIEVGSRDTASSSSSPRQQLEARTHPEAAASIGEHGAEETADTTLRVGDFFSPTTQQSDVTMPIAMSAGSSRQPSPTPSLVLPNSPTLSQTDVTNDTERPPAFSPSRQSIGDTLMDITEGEFPQEQRSRSRLNGSKTSVDLTASLTPPLTPLRMPTRRSRSKSPSRPQQASRSPTTNQPSPPRGDRQLSPPQQPAVNASVNDEEVARAAAAQPPTPPRRQLRTRNAAQLNPYTLEAMRYQRALIRNDWEDAVVSQREWHRQERKRLAEEATRAENEKRAAQGSEQESQSQWLVPSSDSSSQADPGDRSLPSSPPLPTVPEMYVDISAFTADDVASAYASGSRPRRTSPTPSQSGTLPELSEMLARSTKNRHRSGQNAHATYKGHRSIAIRTASSREGQTTSTEESQISEEAIPPLPPPTRRKHTLLALSPSDTEDQPGDTSRSRTNQDALTVDSSEDERPPPSAAKPRRRSRWSGDGSSSDSTDYERRFRQLKKMMPAGMARKHIRDLRAMRHGKAYHSDGHVSSSSSDGGPRNRVGRTKATRTQPQQAEAGNVSDNSELRPGQTRKRLRRHDSNDGNAPLLDPDSDSSSSSSSSSVSSVASITIRHSTFLDPETGSRQFDEAEEADEAPAAWWSVNRLDSYVPFRERDAIDRMLSRTGGRKAATKSAARKGKGPSHHRQANLNGFVSSHRHRERKDPSPRSHLREIDQNQHRRLAIDVSEKDVQQRARIKKKKRRKMDPRVGRTTSSSTRQAPLTLRNPPVVHPRMRPRLDLEHHDVLFAANPIKAAKSSRRDPDRDDGMDVEEASDDGGHWQDFSSILADSSPAIPQDPRLTAPRHRASALPQPVMPVAEANRDALSTPLRGNHSSPIVSVASKGMERQTSMTDRSPGTPARAGQDAIPHRLRTREATRHNTDDSPASRTSVMMEGNSIEIWDDFEGISMDFGMAPLADERSLDVAESPILARLGDLIALPDRLLRGEPVPRTWSGEVLRLGDTMLTMDMDHTAMHETLPFFMDDLRLHISRSLHSPPGEELDDHARRHAWKLVADTGAFLSSWLMHRLELNPTNVPAILASYQVVLEKIGKLQTSVLAIHDAQKQSRAFRDLYQLLCLHLAWTRFEICWSTIAVCDLDPSYALEPDAPSVEMLLGYARALMSLLLRYGLHRCVKNFRRALAANRNAGTPPLDVIMEMDDDTSVPVDEPTSMWLGTIHLLDSFEKGRGIMDGRLFWTQIEAAFQRWDETMPKRAPLLRSESLWYCLFACMQLSQASSQGQVQPAPLLRECWPLVTRALNLVKFRSDESNETAMGWHMLSKRDAYVRIVLQRCCLLASEWRWTMYGAEITLARLFDIFNSHRLADLPTETGHDFPAFLRDFDTAKLSAAEIVNGESLSDPSFHLFVQLLARTGQELRASATDAKDGDRRISRLFSRMTPVRVMPFTRTDVPTRSQRSVLFNHYTVVMLFLHLVPSSFPQRLRQVQSFLPAFKEADFLSQVTYIRAMMYVAVIFRHHHVELTPVTKWFAETIAGLRREYEEIESATKQFERQQLQHSVQHRGGQAVKPDATRMAAIFENAPARQAALRRKEEVARLLIVMLRSIQHVIRHEDLNGTRKEQDTGMERLPDQLLLNSAWLQDMLEAQIALEPRIGQEVLKCVQTFLLARMRVLQPNKEKSTSNAASTEGTSGGGRQAVHGQQRDEDSQDSFAELFEVDDDFDFEDPLLVQLLDGAGAPPADEDQKEAEKEKALSTIAEKKKWDRSFAELVKTSISPSLFQLLSNIYHPDRRIEAASTGSVVMSLGVTERLSDPHPSHGGRNHNPMDRLLKSAEARQFLELVVDCWAGCAHVLVSNGMREWPSYFGFGNESWKRIDDPIGRRDVGLRFLQNLISLDPTAVSRKEYEIEFVAVWAQTAMARVLSVQDVFTRSLIDAHGQGELLAALVAQWQTLGLDLDMDWDLDAFAKHRQALLRTTYTGIATLLTAGTMSNGAGYAILSALLASLRAYVEDTPRSATAAAKGYLRFCRDTLRDVEEILGGTGVLHSLKAELTAAKQGVEWRFEGPEQADV